MPRPLCERHQVFMYASSVLWKWRMRLSWYRAKVTPFLRERTQAPLDTHQIVGVLVGYHRGQPKSGASVHFWSGPSMVMVAGSGWLPSGALENRYMISMIELSGLSPFGRNR